MRSALTTSAFVLVADAAPVMMWLSEPDGWRTFFNQRWLDFRGRTLADEIGEGWMSGVHDDDRDRCLAAYSKARRGGIPLEIEYRVRRADGAFRHVVDRAAPRFGDDGRIAGLIGCCIDITERAAAEQLLAASESRFRLLAEHARDAVYRYRVTPPRGSEYVSPGILDLTGHTPEEFYADADLGVKSVHPDDRHLVAQALQDDTSQLRELVVVRWIHPNGRIVWAEHRRVAVRDDQGRLIAIEGIGRNVTERVETQQRLLESDSRLRESESHLRRLAAGLEDARETERTRIARELHDELGQSLTSIKIQLARTARALVKQGLEPAAIDGLQSIVGGVDVATESVRRLATSLRPPPLDHLGLVAAIELEAASLARPSGLRLRITGNRRVKNLDDAHATAVFRIVQEALTNVVRHAAASAITVSINGSTRDTSVTVRDNGRGMSDQHLPGPKAIGLLGMAERSELIGATLTVSSMPGKGTTVSIRIPLKPDRDPIGIRP